MNTWNCYMDTNKTVKENRLEKVFYVNQLLTSHMNSTDASQRELLHR